MRIAVFGASGYTGRLAVAELARRGVPAVLVGRDAGRLRSAAEEAGIAAPEIRIAAADDLAGLTAALEGCEAVVNCAGPFHRWGEGVIRAALAAGCHYVDTTGEQPYLDRAFREFDEPARRAGRAVVPGTTDDGLPSDLIAALTAARVGEAAEIALVVDLVGGGASQGTVRSMGAIRDTLLSGGLGYEDAAWVPRATARRTEMVPADESEPRPVLRFALPAMVTVPRHVPTRRFEALATKEVSDLFTTLTPELADSLPFGPEVADRTAMRWSFAVEAVGVDGRRARGVVRGRDAYGTTAVIAVEAARRLVADGAPAGVLAHAQAFDPAGFLDHLGAHGVSWSVEDEPAPGHR
ncbi:saccharopine dehydrogenase family protein [Streptomyces palmae]|uniref:Saccharopine dehydrogenase n=1 Tax=Streptomyces palmae TaxID=1701085 RepID=A0A4Z0GZN2_9ACTN|nr:saccharopine dehydrogenase NADP-binding domain-containing protein [Streptomyces palmae]TGB02976.1 saccharopine dehydrogenase [Streptomyces palmae]